MNIFKTLASGSGSINEPNVSAFLGYLLNPKEDHGLGDAFLKRFLKPMLAKKDKLKSMRDKNLSIRSNFEFEVLLEQAFKDDESDDRNQIVDIVILCYEKKSQKGYSLAEDTIKQRKNGADNLKQIFLIENKIKDDSVTKEQLKKQFEKTILKLKSFDIKNPHDLVSVIFVTPEGKNSIEEFDNLKETNDKVRLPWHTKKGDSISKLMREIIEEESQPIDIYCKHTLQAFLEFIENDFKSTIKVESEAKGKDYSRYNFNGTVYPKNGLVRAVIAKYVVDHPNTTLPELQSIFTKQLTGDRRKECVLDANEAKKQEKTLIEDNKTSGYYFIKDDELITLKNGEQIAVCSWWAIDNLPNFIKQAEKLGYTISKSDL